MANLNDVIFKLKANTPGKLSPINLHLYFDKIRFKYATGQKIKPEHWNNKTKRPYLKNSEKGLTVKLDRETIRENEKICFALDEYQAAAKKYFEYLIFQREPITPERLKELFNNDFRPEQPNKQPKQINLNTFIEKFITEIETGKRLTDKGERFKPNTLKNYTSFKAKFDEYQKDKFKKLNFEQITIDFYKDFIEYFTKKDYKLNTIGRHIKTLKTIMRAARDEGHHQNNEVDRKQFKTLKTEVDTVYLTESEINALQKLDLKESPHLDRIRDIFLVGVYTAQRYSDYSRIKKHHIKTLDNGTQIIELRQVKTGIKVSIPIKPELLTILQKYNFELPKSHEQKVNENIKNICKDAEIEEPQEIEIIKGGLKVKTTVPKHRLITTHTARRTGATQMFLNGIPTIAAMKITGHTTERQYLSYIKVTGEQNASKLALHPYFNTTPLKVAK